MMFEPIVPCSTDLYGDLPLRVDDSEEMVLYAVLRDAVSIGWLPINFSHGVVKASPASNTGTPLPSVAPPVTVVDSLVVRSKRRHYRGVRQRPWGKYPAEIRDPAKNGERIQPQQNWIWQIETALCSIDTQNIRKQIQEGINHVADEIKNSMQQVCKTHNLSIAGVWARCRHSTSWSHGGGNSCRSYDDSNESGRGDFVVSVREMLITNGCDFSPSDLMVFDSLPMRVGQGLVGNAFLSDKPFLCRDVTQLSMSVCPIVHTAKSFGLTGCIIVCLQSVATGTRDYVLTFYLPPHKTYAINFNDFLSSMLGILKHHLESFEAVVIDLGDGLFIEVNKFSIDSVFESLKTCPPVINEIDPGVLQDEGEVQQSNIPSHHLAAEELKNSGGNEGDSVGLVEERGKAIVPENICAEKKSKAPNQKESSCTYETLKQHFGQKLVDAAESLGVSRSTVKRWCRDNNIKRWPFPKRSKITSLPPIPNQVIVPILGNVESISDSSGKCLSCSHVSTNLALKHAMDTVTINTVTVKATYKNDIIKFQLSFSSKVMDLVKNVILRLKLIEGTFVIKYLDNEGDYVLIACDDDLRECINSFRKSEETTVKMLIEPLSTAITG